MHIFYQPLIGEGVNYLDEEESSHAVKVLRLKEQGLIQVVDGKGRFFNSLITRANPRKCEFQVNEIIIDHPGKKHYIHLAIAPIKNNDRMEWLVEKSVEFGIDEISFLNCKHSERKDINTGRIEKKAITAMKQSLKANLPKLNSTLPFSTFIQEKAAEEQKFIAYVDETIPQHLKEVATPDKTYCILIGPEGDFSPDEISLAKTNGFHPVSLGKSRLRTETAGMAACLILNLINNF
ncbi:16S rRNA (uracil(1498)-N(3))-methyltransferase [soil metagenome]